jgi:hypothetical protein
MFLLFMHVKYLGNNIKDILGERMVCLYICIILSYLYNYPIFMIILSLLLSKQHLIIMNLIKILILFKIDIR